MKALLILTKEVENIEDSEIFELFAARDERAVAEVKEKYGGVCRSVALSMLRSSEDAEECVNDVYIVLWNKIPPAPDNLKAFICRVTKNICLKRLEYNSAEKRNGKSKVSLSELEETLGNEDFTAKEDNTEIGEAISSFLRSQEPDVRNVFMRRYWLMESVKEIAARFSFSESKVKSMLFHTRNKLRKYLKKEGFYL